ncbi:IS110 family transposase [Methylocaldum sp. BRCS4]|uniref:IS110 family transposase n=1 Tax=Methylocaldum sp. 14B TaxID=1912213 RepID=UPI000989F404|nr:IS110 family transposase [Methylocaldum sp. 14B]MVF23706.1 IS110 family transposase [Methylocaldum sp. BRCS4]
MAKRKQEVEIHYPHAAGIDIGSTRHFVAVPVDRDPQPVREFEGHTVGLRELAAWLKTCGITEVAMESTGVYWIPLYELLAEQGFTVFLVNARHVRNVPGRKSDVLDCQWLQRLMSFGLLRGAFRPEDEICTLRALWRHRDMLIAYQGSHVQHLQKALNQMNVQLHHVIADIVGVTGQRIVRAILAGERDPRALAALRDRRIQADGEAIAKVLLGNWREEHLFALRQAMELYDVYAQKIADCDQQLQSLLENLRTHELPAAGLANPKARKSRPKNAPGFAVREALYGLAGVDLTRIDGIDTSTAMKIISEVGSDLSAFPTVKHFTSWLGLCPGTKISGGKVLSGATKRSANRAAQALRIAAQSLRKSDSALGAYHRRLCARMDRPKAITATAHKLARLIYTLLTKGTDYVDVGAAQYERQFRDRTLQNLKKRAQALGFELTPLPEAA